METGYEIIDKEGMKFTSLLEEGFIPVASPVQELEEICKPVVEYLKKNYDPHCTVVITDSHIKLVRDEIGIPVKTAPEVPVQEQSSQMIKPLNDCKWISELAEQIANCLTTQSIPLKESINIQVDSEALSEVLKKLPKKNVAIHDIP